MLATFVTKVANINYNDDVTTIKKNNRQLPVNIGTTMVAIFRIKFNWFSHVRKLSVNKKMVLSVLLCWCVDILLVTFLELDKIEPFSFDHHLTMGGGGGGGSKHFRDR